jgi:hypothetical protein
MQFSGRDILVFTFGLVTLGVGGVLAIVYAGGSTEAVIGRAGLITAILGPVLGVAVLILNRQADTQHQLDGHAAELDGHGDQLEAAQARIAFLEERLRNAPAVHLPQGAQVSLVPPDQPVHEVKVTLGGGLTAAEPEAAPSPGPEP